MSDPIEPSPEMIEKYEPHCVKKPADPDQLEADALALRNGWAAGFYEYTVRRGDSLKYIASREAAKGSGGGNAPRGFDWKFLCRFNWGTDYPPHINWFLIKWFHFVEDKNMTADKKNYTFKGGETLKIPYKPGATRPGPMSFVRPSTVNRPPLSITSVVGPSFMIADNPAIPVAANARHEIPARSAIEAVFKVTGYSVPLRDVANEKRNAVKWKLKNITQNSEEISTEEGEEITLKYERAVLGDTFRAFPFLDDEANINNAVYVEFKVVTVQVNHDIARKKYMTPPVIKETDPINRIHNPAVVLIGANTTATAAIFRITAMEPDTRAAAAKKFPFPDLPANHDGFIWKIVTHDDWKGKARFYTKNRVTDNTGSECRLYGTEPGLFVLEAWAEHSKRPCARIVLKSVRERTVYFRINRLTSVSFGAPPRTYHTNHSIAKIKTYMAITNIYLRQMGIKLVPDPNATRYYLGSGVTRETTTRVEAGYFNITGLPKKNVYVPNDDTAEETTTINCRPGVLNYMFAHRDKTDFNSAPPGYTFGIGPDSGRNLHTKPFQGLPVGAGMSGMTEHFKGPIETSADNRWQPTMDDKPAITPIDTTYFKELTTFAIPERVSGTNDKIGIVIYNANPAPNPVLTVEEYDSEMGATLAHEFGHSSSVMHRGADDGLQTSTINCMFANDNENERPTDFDLLQTEVFRGHLLAMNDSNNGNLQIKAFLGRGGNLSGAENTTKKVTIEVTRSRTRVKNSYLNFYLKKFDDHVDNAAYTTFVEIKSIEDWDDATKLAEKGVVKVEFELKAKGKVKLLVFAGENDDVVKTEIDCEVTD